MSFNGIHGFDAPIIGPPSPESRQGRRWKAMANSLIVEGAKHWDMPSQV